MRPFSEGLHGFPRLVRDLSKDLGKKVCFRIEGAGVQVDRDILEKLEAPLNHLIRNAVDHGLETPEERSAAGKPEEGTITLEARHMSGMLNIVIRDDGRGIDLESLRRKVVERGYVSGQMAESLSTAELMDFLFLPGFSTAGKVTEISGRGVGLDVVLSMVQEVRGTVRAESTLGQGASFHLQLPLTLSVLRTLLVDIAGQPYAIPLVRIDQVLRVPYSELKVVEDRQYCEVNGENIGILDARQVLQIGERSHNPAVLSIVVISDRLNRYGLLVENLRGERDLVVIPLNPRLGKVPNISAGAILEDGTPALILDADDLVRSIDGVLTQGRTDRIDHVEEQARLEKKSVLVVDDSLTVREVERRLLENRGYEVRVAVDGIDGWNAVQRRRFDLVVTDVDMPRMDGIALVTRIKSHQNLRAIPVMIVSYKDREEDRLRGMEAGANYYLTKSSFHDESLLSAVKDLIGEP